MYQLINLFGGTGVYNPQSVSPILRRVRQWARGLDLVRVSFQEIEMLAHMGLADIRVGFGGIFEKNHEFHVSVSSAGVQSNLGTAFSPVEKAIAPNYSAKMPNYDWNDLRYLLALHRTGNLTHAGRIVGASETTVTRRIRALEGELGTSLFLRSGKGRYVPTDAALQILTHAETIERESLAIQDLSGETIRRVAGCLRISSVPIVVNHILVPHLRSLTRRHPLLTIELVPTTSNLDLAKREADLAVRFARPAGGGLRIKAQKLGEMSFAAYVARSVPPERSGALGWITYDDTHADLPQARWLEAAARASEEHRAPLKVADVETAREAIANGLGKSLLPRMIADSDPRLRAMSLEGGARFPTREVWLLAHVDQAARTSIIAAKEWLKGICWD